MMAQAHAFQPLGWCGIHDALRLLRIVCRCSDRHARDGASWSREVAHIGPADGACRNDKCNCAWLDDRGDLVQAAFNRTGRHDELMATGRMVLQAIVLVAGARLMALAGSADGHVWLGWFALVPLFFAIRWCRPVWAFVCGAIWGGALYTFSAGQSASAAAPAIANFLLLTTSPAVYTCLGALLTRRIGFSPVALAVGWMGVAFALHHAGSHMGLFGAQEGHLGALDWISQALGWIFISFAFALVSAWLVVVLSGVRLCAGDRRTPTSIDDYTLYLAPQTFAGFPLFSVPASHPRAPPISSYFPSYR